MPLRPIAYASRLQRHSQGEDADFVMASDLEYGVQIDVTDNNNGTGGDSPMRYVGRLVMTSYGSTVEESRDRMIAGLQAAIDDLRAA